MMTQCEAYGCQNVAENQTRFCRGCEMKEDGIEDSWLTVREWTREAPNEDTSETEHQRNTRAVVGTAVFFLDVFTHRIRHGIANAYYAPFVWEIKPSRGETCYSDQVWAEDGCELAEVAEDNRGI